MLDMPITGKSKNDHVSYTILLIFKIEHSIPDVSGGLGPATSRSQPPQWWKLKQTDPQN